MAVEGRYVPVHFAFFMCALMYISREFGSGTRMQYEKYFTENGIIPDKIRTCAIIDSTHGIINAVISGLGISIVSELAVRQMLEQKTLLSLKVKKELPARKIYAVLNKNIIHSHLIKLFMEYTAIKSKAMTS